MSTSASLCLGGVRIRVLLLVALALSCALPSASAGIALTLWSAHDVALDANARIDAAGGVVQSTGFATGEHAWRNASGVLEYVTWDASRATAPGVDVRQAHGDVRVERIHLHEATLGLILRDDWVRFRALAQEGGRVVVSGPVEAVGRPVVLASGVSDSTAEAPLLGRSVPDLDWTWERGWAFVGAYAKEGGLLQGFPGMEPPAVRLQGAVALRVDGGNLTLRQGDGAERTLRLGNWTEGATTGLAGDAFVAEKRGRVLFRGTVEDAQVPVTASWGLAAPSVDWSLDGAAHWPAADVEIEGDRMEHVPVSLVGAGTLRIRVEEGAFRYEGEGDWEVFSAGAPVAGPATLPRALAAPLATAALLVVLLAALKLLKALFPSYTRIPPSKLLRSEVRRRIVEEVQASPGIHMRELHRRVGGGWGAFRVHLRLLAAAGHVTLVKAGGLRTVQPGRVHATLAPHPTGARILELLAQRETLTVSEAASRLSLSPQLARYHARKLAEEGLVELVDAPGGKVLRRPSSSADAGR